MLELYHYYRSSASFRVRIALHLKEVRFQDKPIHLVNHGGEQFSEEYQKINPQSLVPTLKDGDKIITQSLAIIDYIDQIHPKPSLFSTDAYQTALIRAFALTITADTHPLNNLRVLKYLSQNLHISEEQKTQWYQHWMHLSFSALEKQLVTLNNPGPCCFGETPTLADICLIPQMYNARRFACDISEFKKLIQIDAYCQTIPAFQKAWPNESSI